MKNYIGNCIEVDSGVKTDISKYFQDATLMSNFLDTCVKKDINKLLPSLVLPKDLKTQINDRPDDFEAGIYKDYDDGMVYLYDKDQDIHYFFI